MFKRHDINGTGETISSWHYGDVFLGKLWLATAPRGLHTTEPELVEISAAVNHALRDAFDVCPRCNCVRGTGTITEGPDTRACPECVENTNTEEVDNAAPQNSKDP